MLGATPQAWNATPGDGPGLRDKRRDRSVLGDGPLRRLGMPSTRCQAVSGYQLYAGETPVGRCAAAVPYIGCSGHS